MNRTPERERARVLVITGPGKGKTTSALGMALRGLGHGKRVLLARFAKTESSGELAVLAPLDKMTILNDSHGMFPRPGGGDFAMRSESTADLFRRMRSMAAEYDMLVLDEICGVVAHGMVEEKVVLAFIADLSPRQILILTGRNATPGLLAAADTVSHVECIKHGYEAGIPAEAGVEF